MRICAECGFLAICHSQPVQVDGWVSYPLFYLPNLVPIRDEYHYDRNSPGTNETLRYINGTLLHYHHINYVVKSHV